MRSVDEMLSGGAPVISWKGATAGHTVKGTLTAEPVVQQDRDFETGEPKTWKDGRPVEVVVISLLTDLRDPSITDDDGERRLYAKANLWKAIRDAVKKGGSPFTTGGTLAVQYTGDDKPTRPGLDGARMFAAQYKPPASRVNELLEGATETPNDLF